MPTIAISFLLARFDKSFASDFIDSQRAILAHAIRNFLSVAGVTTEP
jgi:hypothetical protein